MVRPGTQVRNTVGWDAPDHVSGGEGCLIRPPGLDLDVWQTQHFAMSSRKSEIASSDRRPRSTKDGAVDQGATSEATLLTTWTTKVIEANDAALRLLGVRSTQLVGKPLAVFVDLVDRTAFRSRLQTVPDVGRCSDWRLHLRRPDGSARAVVATVEAASETATKAHCDLRWSMRLDPETKPKVAREDVDALLGHVAHELNQPLAAIVSYARGCLMRIQKHTLTNEDLEMVLEQIIAEALRAGAIIRETRRKDD
jgi:signal transduction histidine kinase